MYLSYTERDRQPGRQRERRRRKERRGREHHKVKTANGFENSDMKRV
jgi:hypothetical protein